MQTTLANDIDIIADKARYDEACRKLLADKYILAWILKSSLAEYTNSSIDDIINLYIEGNPEIKSVRVDPDATNSKIQGISTDDKSLTEGNIFYDIRFNAITPSENGEVKTIIINIESQNDFNPKYPLLKRAAYYCGRMLSAQKGTVFVKRHYEKLQKVVSIWICNEPPPDQQNSITLYSMKEQNVIGEIKNPIDDYDMVTIVMMCLGNPDRIENDVIHLLSVLLSSEVLPKDKKRILQDNFKIPMSYEMENEVNIMCNLSDGVERRGFNRGLEKGYNSGLEKGYDNGVIDTVISYIKRKKVSIEAALDDLDIPDLKRSEYTKILKEHLQTQ